MVVFAVRFFGCFDGFGNRFVIFDCLQRAYRLSAMGASDFDVGSRSVKIFAAQRATGVQSIIFAHKFIPIR